MRAFRKFSIACAHNGTVKPGPAKEVGVEANKTRAKKIKVVADAGVLKAGHLKDIRYLSV